MIGLDSHRDLKQLRSVTLRSDERDTLRVRQRFEQALAAVDWTPAGIPPQALLLVRRMVVRGPTARAVDDRGLGMQVSQALREHSRTARRPWLDALAIDAPAVWFNDEHELAACLVRDWLRGDVSSRWWWRTVLGTAAPADWLRTHVLWRGERVAPVLAQLAGQGHAVAWLKRMDDGDIACATTMLARDYDAPLAVADTAQALAADREDDRSTRTQQARMRAKDAMPSSLARQRLARTVPELLDDGLQPKAIRLLAYALVAVREPGWLRTQALSMAVAQWIEHADAGEASFDAPAANVSGDSVSTHVDAQRSKRAPGQSTRTDRDPRISAGPATDANPTHERRQTTAENKIVPPHAAIETDHDPERAEPHRGESMLRAHDDDAPLLELRADDEPPCAEARKERTSDVLEPLPEARSHATRDERETTTREVMPESQTSQDIETAFGGLFYLLNAALSLGLYGDFSSPRMPGIALSPWDWLALIGRRWFGREFLRDPLWPLLATLAGRRPHDEPGADFDAPARWAISDAWLAPWVASAGSASAGSASAESLPTTVHYRSSGSRLQLWRADGVVLFDVLRDPRRSPRAQAQRLCASLRSLRGARLRRLARMPVKLHGRHPRQRWLSWLLSYLQARLALALGIDGSIENVAALLCRQPASVRCDMTTLQVQLSLATLPLPIRIAGLDRDPGWIPAAGRALQFKFS